MRLLNSILVSALVLTSALTAFAGTTKSSTVTNGTTEISVMTYNVANLFDTKHDLGKDDWAYLPLNEKNKTVRVECAKITVYPWRMECLNLDWNEDVLKTKLDHVADVILSINNGRGPDILILEEVENIGILHRLNDDFLARAGYTTAVLIEGNDDRGIDQAVLSRLPLNGQPVNTSIPLGNDPKSRKQPSRTRGLLQVGLTLPDSTPLTVFGVHFPSGDEHPLRAQAVDYLNKVRAKLPKDALTIVGGDFNINSEEDTEFNMYSGALSPWMITHKIGCQGCTGTEYYKTAQEWSFLDAIGFSKNFNRQVQKIGWYVDPTSIQIPTFSRYQLTDDGRPYSYDAKTGDGVSDHLPMFAIMRRDR